MWKQVNPNPCGKYVGDCVVRALAIVFNTSWEKVYAELCAKGFEECDMPSSNNVWSRCLEDHGYVCEPANGPNIRDYSRTLKNGRFILATGAHVVAVINGDYYDAWDSGNEYPMFVWTQRKEM